MNVLKDHVKNNNNNIFYCRANCGLKLRQNKELLLTRNNQSANMRFLYWHDIYCCMRSLSRFHKCSRELA